MRLWLTVINMLSVNSNCGRPGIFMEWK